MKTYSKTTEETLITFQISGGCGNRRRVEYCEQDMSIDLYADELFTAYENQYEIGRKIGDRENLKALFESAIDGDNKAFDRLQKIGFVFGELEYFDGSGHAVGLPVKNDGTGTIERDYDYDTTIVQKLKHCNEDELLLIHNSANYKSSDVSRYVYEKLLEANLIFEDEIENED
jgi:hypothetical protein